MTKTNFTIRRQEPEDATAMYEVYSQTNVVWGTTMLPHPSLSLWKNAAQEPRGTTRLVACVDGQAIGNIALMTAQSPRRRHSAEVAMAVHDAWQGKGIGYALLSEVLELADKWMDLQRVELEVYKDNERGLRLYKRCGFEIEGTFKNYAFRDGQYVDVYAMARLR